MNRLLGAILLSFACVAATLLAAGRPLARAAQAPVAVSAAEGADRLGEPVEHCDALRAEHLTVSLTDGDQTAFCLVEQAEHSTRYVQLLNVPTAAAFAERRSTAATALAASGVEPCRLTLWWVRRDRVRAQLEEADQLTAPLPCLPLVIAHDPAAAAWSDFTTEVLAAALAEGGQTYAVRPAIPLTVHLYGDRHAYAARLAQIGTAERGSGLFGGSAGVTVRGTVDGVWIALDTTRFNSSGRGYAQAVIRHEAVHYIQTLVTGCACTLPLWFAEGMAELMATPPATAGNSLLPAARAAAADGRAPSLRALERPEQGAATPAAYEQGYAAVSYLVERWGSEALPALLRAARPDGGAAFGRSLSALTGLTLDQFEQAYRGWLLSGA